nr:hypothetical protein [Paraburkholderia pallida]
MSDGEGIDAIGFSARAGCAGEVANLPGIDRDSGQAGFAQGPEQGEFKLAGGFGTISVGFNAIRRCTSCSMARGSLSTRKCSVVS